MSGGVDSSLSAALLKEEGYDILGITIHNNYENSENLDLTEKIAEDLKISWRTLDLSKEFENIVIGYFGQEYIAGRTPNPCVICNLRIKFGLLLEKAKALGADYLATGHYALKEYDPTSHKFLLKRGVDEDKDQSYFLYRLNQQILSSVLFPLGKFKKSQTRELAKKYGLKNYQKEESQEICFIQDNNYRKFLVQHFKEGIRPGKFVDKEGKILGEHRGISFYTIGQRKGLGISSPKRRYVTKIDNYQNTITLGEDKDLYEDTLIVKDLSFVSGNELSQPLKAEVKIRYNGKESPALICPYTEGKVLVIFEQPQRAITPGQSAVFYQKDIVIGGGIIEK